MPQTFMSVLFLAILATPAPPPPKTIITVHSSEFCTALVLEIRPALVGLMRNDQLIGLGDSALKAGDRDVKFGGIAESSFNQRGAATWTANSGDIELLNSRQRQLAAAMEQNVDMVKTVLSNPNAPAPSGDDKSKYAAIKSQIDLILAQQRKAINIISGNADTSDLARISNASPITSIESDHPNSATNPATLNGTSALDSGLTSQHNVVATVGGNAGGGRVSTTDPFVQSQVAIARAEASKPFYSPYENLARALELDQHLIGRTEAAATKTIVQAAEDCQ